MCETIESHEFKKGIVGGALVSAQCFKTLVCDEVGDRARGGMEQIASNLSRRRIATFFPKGVAITTVAIAYQIILWADMRLPKLPATISMTDDFHRGIAMGHYVSGALRHILLEKKESANAQIVERLISETPISLKRILPENCSLKEAVQLAFSMTIEYSLLQ